MRNTLEQKVADTILQRKVRVKLNGKEYKVEPPTMATIIAVSAHVSRLPKFDIHSNILDMLGRSSELEPVADVVATMICGARRSEAKWWQYFKKRKYNSVKKRILYDCTPQEVSRVMEQLLDTMQLKSFFALTVSLKGLNVTETKETVMTASGQ